MRLLALACTAVLAAMPGVAQAAQPCLTPVEASSLFSYALPSAISGTTKRCAPTLGPGAFLRNGAAALSARYATRKAQSWPAAKAAFLKIGGGSGDQGSAMLATLPDPSLQQMLDVVIEGMVAQQIPTERCGDVDRVIGLLAPLPAQNTAELIAVVIGLAGQTGKARAQGFSICKSAS